MAYFKTTFFFFLSMLLGFGMWYCIGWFLSNQENLMLWPWYGKLAFLAFGFSTFSSLIDAFTK